MAKKKRTASPWVVTSLPKLAAFFDVSIRTIDSWRRNGMPGGGRAYNIKAIVFWLRNQGPWRAKIPRGDDPMMSDANSPWMEEYRKERTLMARMDRKAREGELLNRDVIHMMHSRMAAINRRTGKRLEKKFGKEALDIFNSSFENAAREADRVFGMTGDP